MGKNDIASDIEKCTFIMRNEVENTRIITQTYCAFEIGETSKDRRKYVLNLGKVQIGLFFLVKL